MQHAIITSGTLNFRHLTW